MTNTFPKNQGKYLPEIHAYVENTALDNEISVLSKAKGILYRIKKLKALKKSYYTPLALSHIDYYIKKNINHLINRILFCMVIFFTILYFLFTTDKLYKYHDRFFNLDVSTQTFQKAVSYYNSGDYDSALRRFLLLYNNGWKNASTVNYLSKTYQAKNNYNAATELLVNYLNTYNTANITTDNSFYTELINIQQANITSKQLLSDATSEKIAATQDQINSYSALYSQLRFALYTQDYEDAEYYCQTLHTAGADGFYYTAYYTTVLINTERINEAYELVTNALECDNSKSFRQFSVSQRTALFNYIAPHLSYSQRDKCAELLNNDTSSATGAPIYDNTEPFIQYDDVEFLFSRQITNLNYLEAVDKITVDKETTLVNGRECYYIKVIHYDGTLSNSEYFFMDMLQNVYIFMDGKYHLLPVDEPSNAPEDAPAFIERNYHHYDNPDITLNFQCVNLDICTYLIKDNASQEIIFDGTATDTSQYDAFSYFTKDNSSFIIFFTTDDAILLVSKDPEQKYGYLEGRYLLSE